MVDWSAFVGDCRDLPLPDESVEAVVTDPPYGLSFMGREWDHDVPGPEYWTEVKRALKPGGHLLAFGGTRTWHWLTVAIEEAGFDVRDCLSWMYGTGFPKSHQFSRKTNGGGAGWDGWGTALKPGWEPIVLAMKPTDGTFAENALEHGVAGLNIDGCRIAANPDEQDASREHDGASYEDVAEGYQRPGSSCYVDKTDWHMPDNGRWPANVTLSHTRWCRKVGTRRVRNPKHRTASPKDQEAGVNTPFGTGGEDRADYDYADEDGMEEVEDWDCPPSCAVRQLDEDSGERPAGAPLTGNEPRSDGFSGEVYGEGMSPRSFESYGDTGGASRFYYCAKASRSEREAGLPDVEGRANQHPTVKPIDLCRWLVRLVTRPDHTVLDPFMGSGSIGCAAVQERRDYVGLDLEPEYVEIARQRIKHWHPDQRDLFLDRVRGTE